MGYLTGTTGVRYWVYPRGAGAAGAVSADIVGDGASIAWAWNDEVAIVAVDVIPDPCWLAGIFTHLQSCPGPAAWYGDLAILANAAIIAIISTGSELATPVEGINNLNWLPKPVRLDGQPALGGAIRKDTAASAAGVHVRLVLITGLED